MAFENHFEADRRGKRDWLEGRFRSSKIYGWVARAGDYTSAGPAGDHLRKNGDLKSVGDLAAEESGRADRLVANLASQIEVKSKHLRELECKYNETSLSLDTMMEQRDLLLQSYNEGSHLTLPFADLAQLLLSRQYISSSYLVLSSMLFFCNAKQEWQSCACIYSLTCLHRHSDLSVIASDVICVTFFDASEIQRMQQLARHNSRRVLAENESLRSELDSKRRELEARGKQLEKLVAQNEIDTRKLAEEKRKVAIFFMRAMFCLFHVWCCQIDKSLRTLFDLHLKNSVGFAC
ncbi:XH domain [Musa troglodytarum]|nr:XH domain [Musa troglodytarum]